MSIRLILPLIFILIAVLTQVFFPFAGLDDLYRPGVGALVGGGVGILFVLFAGIAALVARRSQR